MSHPPTPLCVSPKKCKLCSVFVCLAVQYEHEDFSYRKPTGADFFRDFTQNFVKTRPIFSPRAARPLCSCSYHMDFLERWEAAHTHCRLNQTPKAYFYSFTLVCPALQFNSGFSFPRLSSVTQLMLSDGYFSFFSFLAIACVQVSIRFYPVSTEVLDPIRKGPAWVQVLALTKQEPHLTPPV